MSALAVAVVLVAGALLAPAPPPAPLERPPAPTSTLEVHEHEHEHEIPAVWLALAECESHGEWDYGPHSTWGSRIFEGGLQHHPDTWDAYRDPDHPEAAYLASPAVQVEVAERVLADQGWRAWPACSRALGLRP